MNGVKTENNMDMVGILAKGSGPGRGRRFLVRAGWLILALALVFAGIRWGTGKDEDKTEYKTETAGQGNLVITVAATGTLQPINQVDVGSELSGIIRTVEVDFNDRVEAGQVLARLDTVKLETQVQQYKASLESAQARVQQIRATVRETGNELARIKESRRLSNNRVPSKRDLDTAEAAHERALADETAALASVSQARAALKTFETDLSRTLIYSPVNGIVLKRSIEPGQTVAASLQAPILFTLAEDLSRMELSVDIDEADVGRVQAGQKAVFTVDGYPDISFPARITQVRYGSKIVSGVVTYETILSVDNPDLLLRPGMTATVKITVNEIENAVLVPNAALRYTPPAKEKGPSGGNSSIIGKLFPRPRRAGMPQKDFVRSERKKSRVWTLKDGQPLEIFVTPGETDGVMTVITGPEVTPGMVLIVDTLRKE
ncbi:MAG: efflux RND transporter periplasmic adaptor subunit [Desulfobacteraceae bacterium]|nr:efflux RND transporter periplasmic adaptor subunit [Desulfobacteraceae bacterium]